MWKRMSGKFDQRTKGAKKKDIEGIILGFGPWKAPLRERRRQGKRKGNKEGEKKLCLF